MSDPAGSDVTGAAPLDGLVDLVAERLGGRAIEANDEFFAPKESLLKATEAEFDPDRYTDRGKWMDGWETRRRRTPGHDWCIVALGAPGRLRRIVVDTRHFRGNHPEACSLDASAAASGDDWVEVLPRRPLAGDTPNVFGVDEERTFTRVRLNIFPDGGVARLRVYGEPRPDWEGLVAEGARLDLASAALGGAPLLCSDRFFSDPRNLLLPGPSTHMGDGWETRRRRGPGHDWVLIRLARRGIIEEAEIDTSHFKGNYPATCSLDGTTDPVDTADPETLAWTPLLERTELEADSVLLRGVTAAAPVTHVRFNIFPDGGVARLRLWGRVAS